MGASTSRTTLKVVRDVPEREHMPVQFECETLLYDSDSDTIEGTAKINNKKETFTETVFVAKSVETGYVPQNRSRHFLSR